jgi:hypothetical protein
LITINEVCTGFWRCLKPTDWIQLASVFIAMLAAIASYVTVVQQKKQFQAANEERELRYKPQFKINFFDFDTQNKLIFDIVNEGFPYFITKEVKWVGDESIVADFFHGEVGNDTKGRHQSLVVILKLPSNVSSRGYFEVSGFDIENNLIKFDSPEIIFEKGKVDNRMKLSFQYLK